MKYYLLIALVFCSLCSFAGEHILIASPMNGKNFNLNFRTKKIWPNGRCELKVTSLDIVSPVPQQDSGFTFGKILMTTQLDQWKPCMTGSGPHHGVMNFRVGWSLPELHYGTYEVSINKIVEGKLHLAYGASHFESN